jgi:hypothetical protein
MGATFATDLASMDGLSIQQQLEIHLTSNFYPPVPASMAEPCMHAIQAYWEDDLDRLIILPDGVSWRGESTAPAYAMINQHRLYPWTEESEDE